MGHRLGYSHPSIKCDIFTFKTIVPQNFQAYINMDIKMSFLIIKINVALLLVTI